MPAYYDPIYADAAQQHLRAWAEHTHRFRSTCDPA